MARSFAVRPCESARHCGFRAAALEELDHRRVGARERVLLLVEAVEAEGKAGEVEDGRRRMALEHARARSGRRAAP